MKTLFDQHLLFNIPAGEEGRLPQGILPKAKYEVGDTVKFEDILNYEAPNFALEESEKPNNVRAVDLFGERSLNITVLPWTNRQYYNPKQSRMNLEVLNFEGTAYINLFKENLPIQIDYLGRFYVTDPMAGNIYVNRAQETYIKGRGNVSYIELNAINLSEN